MPYDWLIRLIFCLQEKIAEKLLREGRRGSQPHFILTGCLERCRREEDEVRGYHVYQPDLSTFSLKG